MFSTHRNHVFFAAAHKLKTHASGISKAKVLETMKHRFSEYIFGSRWGRSRWVLPPHYSRESRLGVGILMARVNDEFLETAGRSEVGMVRLVGGTLWLIVGDAVNDAGICAAEGTVEKYLGIIVNGRWTWRRSIEGLVRFESKRRGCEPKESFLNAVKKISKGGYDSRCYTYLFTEV